MFLLFLCLSLSNLFRAAPSSSGHFECILQQTRLCNVFTFQCDFDVELVVVVFCFIFSQQLDEENEGRSLRCFLEVDGMDQFVAAKLLLLAVIIINLQLILLVLVIFLRNFSNSILFVVGFSLSVVGGVFSVGGSPPSANR